VFGTCRYFDLAADERFDVIELQRRAADVDTALTLGASGFIRLVTIATETIELAVDNL